MGNTLGQKFHNGYRSVFRFKLRSDESVGSVAEYYVRDWLAGRRRGADRDALEEWDGTGDISLPSGAKVEAIWFEDERNRRNAVRYKVTDEVERGRFQVRVSVMSSGLPDRQVVFLVEVLRDFGDEENVAHEVDPPRIVKNVLDSRQVFDGDSYLQGQPRAILWHNLDELLDAIADPNRQVPLLVACSVSAQADEQWRSVIEGLTKSSIGTAAVYTVFADAVEDLNDRLPEALRTEPGHMRAIAPRVDMENPVVRRHPLWTPEQLGSFLDSEGRVKDKASGTVAQGPRTRLLESNLPPEVRRILQLLDQVERQRQLSETVAERVTEVIHEEESTADLVDQTVEASARAFPSRSEVHGRKQEGDDFWGSFQALLARWLNKDSSEVTESTVEADLRAVDERILRDREALQVNEQYMEEVEEERDDLKVHLSELKEENDSLRVQLDAASQRAEEARELVERLRSQLEGLRVEPEDSAEEELEAPRLGELQEKIEQVNVERAAFERFEPNVEIGKALQFLGERLDPLIQDRLNPHLKGLPWTAVLEELDVVGGREPGSYRRSDPAAGLRMLTERLGNLGFYFEVDGLRTVSNLGGALRSYRNRWSHHHNLEVMDAARVYDSIYLLLKNLEDVEGAKRAKEERNKVHTVLGITNGLATEPVGPETPAAPTEADGLQVEDEVARVEAPESEVGTADAGSGTDASPNEIHEEPPFVGWETREILPTDYLDLIGLPSKRRVAHEVIERIVESEAPVRFERLVGLVAAEFGVNRVHKDRAQRIKTLIKTADVFLDEEDYVWRKEKDPSVWGGFRPTTPGDDREFTHVSPVEVRNAALFVLESAPALSRGDLEYEVLRIFDRQRRTGSVVKHLSGALKDLPRS